MQLNVSSWGNSLGLRIPKSIAELMGIANGSQLRGELKGGKLILSPLGPMDPFQQMAKGVDLQKLTAKITAKNQHRAEEDEAAGREVW